MSTYTCIGELGKGTFGTVYLCERRHNKMKIVVKEINLDSNNVQLVAAQNEVTILRALNHPNICQYYDSFRRGNRFSIVMEFAKLGNLYEYLKRRHSAKSYLPSNFVFYIFCQILLGLDHIHTKKIIHRDLKTENIFLTGRTKNIIKIGDFGISKILKTGDETARTVIGTTNYLAPEMCDGKPYDNKSDIWSLGCILYEVCALERLFQGSVGEIVLAIKTAKRKSIKIDKYGTAMQEIIDVTTQNNPATRPTTTNLMAFPILAPKLSTITLNLGNIVNILPMLERQNAV